MVAERYQKYLIGQKHFLDEVEDGEYSRMVYMSTYTYKGVEHPVILVSLIDEIEITSEEFILVVAMVLSIVAVLVFLFGSLLLRLSQRLIEPSMRLKLNSIITKAMLRRLLACQRDQPKSSKPSRMS